jgi:hypothetical protein
LILHFRRHQPPNTKNRDLPRLLCVYNISAKEDKRDDYQNSNLCLHGDLLFENILGLCEERAVLETRKGSPQRDINSPWRLHMGIFRMLLLLQKVRR